MRRCNRGWSVGGGGDIHGSGQLRGSANHEKNRCLSDALYLERHKKALRWEMAERRRHGEYGPATKPLEIVKPQCGSGCKRRSGAEGCSFPRRGIAHVSG
jgi:hypothetical protein